MTKANTVESKDKVAGKIAGAEQLLKTEFARLMNRLFFKKSWLLLVIYTITAGGCSVYILLKSFLSEPVTSLDLGKLQVPVLHRGWRQPNELSGEYVDRQTYEQITTFKTYMDSLESQGSPLYDSIMRARPHLPDSLAILEGMYHSQNK